ncbi:MAG: multicopper oxidase family protein [Verrucomicrobia bacterium]|nr:multicopper oxidase family protein [Verrucomicrobiota bacterium]
MRTLISALAILFASSLSAEPTASYGICKATTPEATRVKIIEAQIKIKGQSSPVYKIVVDGGDEILQKWKGECFNVIVENQTSVPTSLHWHGLILPVLEDGVSYVTQAPIPPRKSQPYNFQIVQSGTYFSHSHYGLQEQKLMSIPLILLSGEENQYRDIVVYFEDFTFQSLDAVWQGLRKKYIEMTKTNGSSWKPAFSPQMPGMRPDLSDVKYDAYLSNRTTLESPPIYPVKPGEEIRLRLINASTATGFLVTLGGLKGRLIAVDGNPVEPTSFDAYSFATAQRMDIVVTIPKEGGAFPILAQGEGTNMATGFVLKTADAAAPALPMEVKETIGAITNEFEKQLKALQPLPPKKVDRLLTVELEGNMQFYTWAINNRVWPDNQRLIVKEGERVEMTFINKTGMSHPMHLHGHVFQVIEIDGQKFSGAIRDTVLVMPNQTLKVQFDANNPGIWALHCHISYHSWGGMMTEIVYEGYKPPYFSPSTLKDYSGIYGGY